MSGQKIAVLMGGISSEREISFSSGKEVAAALKKKGYVVRAIEVTEDLDRLIRRLKAFQPDVVFNALHGRFGEDGCIQGVLNWLKIPYTHSGVLASSVGMDKEMTRHLARQAKVPVAEGGLKTKEEFQKMKLPLVVKPNDEGSSIGVSLVLTETDRKKIKWPTGRKLLVEEYIPGRELSVAVLKGKALGIVELVPKTGWYDFQNKYQAGAVQHLLPAPVSKGIQKKLCQFAEKMHTVLGCRGVSRSDFRLDKNRIVFLEINTNPGMTPTSLVPDMARLKNLSYEELIEELISEARCD
ncbi:MAG: D-alanine--D-alanine ligase [Alphaproteobacteria bacterium]